MNANTYTLHLSYMLDTDAKRYQELLNAEPACRDRLMDAGIENARRVSGHRLPPRDVPTGMSERWKGADRVALEFGLPSRMAPAIGELGALLERAHLGAKLPDGLDERSLRGVIADALNASWRHLYRDTGLLTNEALRIRAGLKSSDDIFAERIARHGRRSSNAPVPTSWPYQAPRMVPGA